MAGVLFLLVIQAFVFGGFCSYIAREKGRNAGNWFLLGLCFSILAVFALIAVPKIEDKTLSAIPLPSTKSDRSSQEDEFVGERNISSPSYQLFLTRRFGIEKNLTLEKFVIGDAVFNTLEDSLNDADYRYGRTLDKIMTEEDNANQKKEQQQMALHDAAKNGHWTTVSRLLKEGADANRKDADGKTALDIARARRNYTIIKVLREHSTSKHRA